MWQIRAVRAKDTKVSATERTSAQSSPQSEPILNLQYYENYSIFNIFLKSLESPPPPYPYPYPILNYSLAPLCPSAGNGLESKHSWTCLPLLALSWHPGYAPIPNALHQLDEAKLPQLRSEGPRLTSKLEPQTIQGGVIAALAGTFLHRLSGFRCTHKHTCWDLPHYPFSSTPTPPQNFLSVESRETWRRPPPSPSAAIR